jgi:hypothetical protein
MRPPGRGDKTATAGRSGPGTPAETCRGSECVRGDAMPESECSSEGVDLFVSQGGRYLHDRSVGFGEQCGRPLGEHLVSQVAKTDPLDPKTALHRTQTEPQPGRDPIN